MKTRFILSLLLAVGVASAQWLEETIYLPDEYSGVVLPRCATFSPVENKLYVAGSFDNYYKHRDTIDNWVVVVDGDNHYRKGRVPVESAVWDMCYNPQQSKVYCANFLAGSVSVIDSRADTVVATIPVAEGPVALCYSRSLDKVYCGHFSESVVEAIDGATNQVVAQVPTVKSPQMLCVNEARKKVYVASDARGMTVIDGTSDTVVATLNISSSVWSLACNAAADKVYYGDLTNRLHVIDCATDTVIAVLEFETWVSALACDTVRNVVFCATDDRAVFVVDGVTDSVVGVVPAGWGPTAALYSYRSGKVYVACEEHDSVWVIDGTGDSVVAVLPSGKGPEALVENPVSGVVYCVNLDSDNTSVIDEAGDSLLCEVAVGCRPEQLCYDPVGDKMYCANGGNGLVSVVDCEANCVAANVKTGGRVTDLACNPGGRKVYCPDRNGSAVWVIDCRADTVSAIVRTDSLPSGVCYVPELNKVYVACFEYYTGNSVWALDGTSDSVLARIPVARNPRWVWFNPAGNKVYCAHSFSRSMTVIDAVADTVVGTFELGGYPHVFAYNAIDRKVYTGGARLTVVDALQDSVILSVRSPFGLRDVVFAPCSSRAFAAYDDDWALLMLDGRTDSTLAVMQMGGGCQNLCQDTARSKVYCTVLCGPPGKVVVVDAGTGGLESTVRARHWPWNTASSPAQGRVFVANYMSSCLSVIRDTTPVAVWERAIPKQRPFSNPTIMRGMLVLPGKQNADLLDVTGQKVMDLQPGENSVQNLSPGVYFVLAGSRLYPDKVVITR